MPFLFAFWPVDTHGCPHPDAATPWGERGPLVALDAYPREAVGPWLTVVDEATEAVLFAGDVSHALRSFAADVADDTDETLDPGEPPLDRALAACHALVAREADEAGRDAVDLWREPDPNTWRQEPLPEHVRRAIAAGAEQAGREAAGRALRDHLSALVLPAACLAA
jgi:hypothetical protein